MPKHCSREDRLKTHTLNGAGLSVKEISRHLNIPAARVYGLRALPVTPKKGRGGKPVVNTPIRCRIIDYLNTGAEARRMTYKDLSKALELNL
ncbi:MAG: hypothetical protein M1823_004161, partial [Watsoniomyces obsoletus]